MGRPYTVFEWLAGRSLERHIAERAGGTSIGEALVILGRRDAE
jgi:Ser/Thr protein kinase RdoA (MazF antagonist)